MLAVLALSHAQAEFVLNEVASYDTGLNVSCFDAYNNMVYFSVQGDSAMPYIYSLQFPSMQMTERSVQSSYVNCVNTMSDGRVLYTTPPAVYQTIPSIDTPFDFYNIKEIKDYKGKYIMLTGYNGIRGTDENGNVTKGLSFTYASLSFTGLATDGESIYASLGNGTIIVFNDSFGETGRIEITNCTNCTLKGISAYGKGSSLVIAATTDKGVRLLMQGKQFISSGSEFNRCIISNSTLVVCSDNSTMHFMEIVNVSEKAREYANLSSVLRKYIANATRDDYVVWAEQQLDLADSMDNTDIMASLSIAKNISIAELQKKAIKPAQNITANGTPSQNVTPSQPQAKGLDMLTIGAIAVALIVIFLVVIGIVAYYVLNSRHGEGGKGPGYRFGG
jgi:hypothetical protein